MASGSEQTRGKIAQAGVHLRLGTLEDPGSRRGGRADGTAPSNSLAKRELDWEANPPRNRSPVSHGGLVDAGSRRNYGCAVKCCHDASSNLDSLHDSATVHESVEPDRALLLRLHRCIRIHGRFHAEKLRLNIHSGLFAGRWRLGPRCVWFSFGVRDTTFGWNECAIAQHRGHRHKHAEWTCIALRDALNRAQGLVLAGASGRHMLHSDMSRIRRSRSSMSRVSARAQRAGHRMRWMRSRGSSGAWRARCRRGL